MALIYEKVPLYKVVKAWDNNDPNLSEVYKLQSSNSRNKSWVEIHKDNGEYGIKFTIDKTTPEFNKGAEKCDLNWSDSFAEFENVLQGHHKTAWKQVLHEHFPEPADATVPLPATQDHKIAAWKKTSIKRSKSSLSKCWTRKKSMDRQYIYLQPGGDYVFQKPMMQSPVENLWWFKEMIRMAEALPAGDMHPPNQALQLEWFYMSFYKEDRAKYIESGWRLSNEMLESVAEYFKKIFNLQVADGSLAKKRERQIEQHVRCKMCHELCKQYNEKVGLVTEQRHGGDGCHSRQDSKYHCHDYKWQDCSDSGRHANYNKHDKKWENKTPSDCGDKVFKPCLVHRPKSKHTSEECHKNPKNDKRQLQDKTRHYEAHHNNTCYTSNDDESHLSTDTPVPSEDPASASSKSKKTHEDENHHLHVAKKMKAGLVSLTIDSKGPSPSRVKKAKKEKRLLLS